MKTLILLLTATFCTTVASAQNKPKPKLEGIYTRIDDTLELKGGGSCVLGTYDNKGKEIRENCKWREIDGKVVVESKAGKQVYPVRTAEIRGKRLLVLMIREVAGEPSGYSKELAAE